MKGDPQSYKMTYFANLTQCLVLSGQNNHINIVAVPPTPHYLTSSPSILDSRPGGYTDWHSPILDILISANFCMQQVEGTNLRA